MVRGSLYLAAAVLVSAPSAVSAQVVLDMSLITCRQFLDSPPERQELIHSWVGGYYSASKNLATVDFRYVARNQKAVSDYCRKNGREGLLSAVQKVAR